MRLQNFSERQLLFIVCLHLLFTYKGRNFLFFVLYDDEKIVPLPSSLNKRNSMRVNNSKIITAFMLISLAIVVVSVVVTNRLAGTLATEEQKKMEIWAEATRQLIMADEQTDLQFYQSIIEQNTTIPVYMTDADDHVLLSRNVKVPRQNREAFYRKKIAALKSSQEPIEVVITPELKQYIYYEDSVVLRELQLFPYIQFAVIFVVMLIVLLAMQIVQRSEQNKVWVGLSKETAHQLGTPISSLNAWLCLLKDKYPEETMIGEMDADVSRLETIAERFSKIGSTPELAPMKVNEVVAETIDYMRHRTSTKVVFSFHSDGDYEVNANRPLLSWVIENLLRNAVDAINGEGQIDVWVSREDDKVMIDVADTGKGIERRTQKDIFQPGYTTKKRGWGLGLSLSKRIIENYHDGRLTLKSSQPGVGSTFRIMLHSC